MRYTDHSTMSRRLGDARVRRVKGWCGMNAGAPALCAGLLAAVLLCSCDHAEPKLVLSKPLVQDTVITRTYAGQVKSGRRMEIRAESRGYLEVVNAREGQNLKKGEPMFKIVQHAPGAAKSTEPEAAVIAAPFDGRMSLLRKNGGSPVREGDLLTTLSDNREMEVDFNMPEAQYQEYAAATPAGERLSVRLLLANGRLFEPAGQMKLEKTELNTRTGTLPQHAVFPNPGDLLRHGESGNVQLRETIKNAVLVPRQATLEIAEHRYVHVVAKDGMVRQRRVSISNELQDFYVVTAGVGADETIVFEGTEHVHDGDKAWTGVFEEPAKAYANLKHKAE